MGRAAPGTAVTATVYLSDTTEKESTSLTAGSTDGWYYWSVPTDVPESDIVAVELTDGTVMSRTVDTLNLNVDVAHDRVTGVAEPGATVRGQTSHLTSVGWQSVLASTTADPATGVYTLEFGTIADIMPGQWAGVFVADAEGEDLNLWGFAPSVEVNQTWNEVSGSGPSDPGPASEGRVVTLTLASTTTLYTTEMDWYSWYSFNGKEHDLPDIGPGDVVTVEVDGFAWQGVVQVQTMTVQHDATADRFTGTVVTPTERVELWGKQWEDFKAGSLYPVGGQFDTLVTADSPFTATPAGFDVRNAVGYEVTHRTPDGYTDRVYQEVDSVSVWPDYDGAGALLAPPGTPYTITLRDSGGGFKAQLTGTSGDPIGEAGWNHFGGTGQQIETDDQLQVQSAAGFNQTVHIPAMTLQFDEANDKVSGSAPADSLLYVSVDNQGEGFVPTDNSGQFAVAVDQLQNFYGDGDLVWGNGAVVCYINEDANQVCWNFGWPQIIAHYDMEGENDVWGRNAFPGNTIYITMTDPSATGTTTAGDCKWCSPDEYQLEFPDGTIVPNNTVIVDFGDGFVDSMTVLTVTAEANPDTDVVTVTAPVGSPVSIDADGPSGWWDWWWNHNDPLIVGASGYVVFDLDAEGYDVVYGTSFNVYIDQAHGHQTQYSFWLPAPELSINKWNVPGHARPGGVVVYGINYQNNGNGVATDTLIVDTLPMSTTWAGDTSGVTPDTSASGSLDMRIAILRLWYSASVV